MPSLLTGTDQDGLVGTRPLIIAGLNVTALAAGITSTVTASVTHSTPGQTYSNIKYDGARVSNTTTDTTYNDCMFTGDSSANALFTATNIAAKRIVFNRCHFTPKFLIADKDAFKGHDAVFNDCLIEKTTDGLSIQNGSQFAATGAGWATGVELHRTMIRRLARWTSATANLGPGDSTGHNDCIQQFGGTGTVIDSSVLDARPARQYAHLYLVDSDGHVFTESEAYNLPDTYVPLSVPMNSLTGGGPFAFAGDANHGPRALPWEDNGSGLLSRGRINSTDWSCIMMNSSQGPSTGWQVSNTLFLGGEYAINGGANPYVAGLNLGTWSDIWFDYSQGSQSSGGNTTQTVNFGGTWSGHVTVTNARYISGSMPSVQVRY